ncbi:MAG: IS1 family transposase [Synechococcales cyanobacterium RU_4_20]|nr:IS1 family transposase [Synechococcales cyanobacterium RU_4_20]NJR67959.1 IS1 family transposase [Synechococcales cyanobacterium CRU_2_2]
MACSSCGSHDISKNGTTRRGKQNYKCRDCNRQYVEEPQWKPKGEDTQSLIGLVLLEKIPLAGIARAIGVFSSWLQDYVDAGYEVVPRAVTVLPKAKGKLKVQIDELWPFVDDKGNKQWVWLALDVSRREVIGCHIGDRSRESARVLWQSLPGVYCQCAMVYTDHWEAYETVIPSKCHRGVGKDSGLTSYIERFNNTLRQRVSRFVRKTLSFSKKLENHVGAIWNFIHEYNRLIREKMGSNDLNVILSILY